MQTAMMKRSCSSSSGGTARCTGGSSVGNHLASSVRCRRAQLTPRPRVVVAQVAAAEPSAASPDQQQQQQQDGVQTFEFACPICLESRFTVRSGSGSSSSSRGGAVAANPYVPCECRRCARTFDAKPGYLDLTLTSGVRQGVYQQRAWQGTELFRQPLVSFVYERGWRQNFAGAGFPGPDKEFDLAMEYVLPVAEGGTLVDASCGTGLFTRRFARSRRFARVVALDFSESMLQQAQAYFSEDAAALAASTPIVAVRADIARLPFPTGSVDAIHAGAAIHCWPNPQAAMAEISRVLRPGGVFVASTFLTPLAPLGEIVGDDTVRPLSQMFNPFGADSRTFRYWQEGELVDLVNCAGLQGYRRARSWQYIEFMATKPV